MSFDIGLAQSELSHVNKMIKEHSACGAFEKAAKLMKQRTQLKGRIVVQEIRNLEERITLIDSQIAAETYMKHHTKVNQLREKRREYEIRIDLKRAELDLMDAKLS